MRIRTKNAKALSRMRDAGKLVAECFALLHESVQPGVPLAVLDKIVEDYIAKQGAEPLYKGYQGSSAEHPPFPGVICASVNHEICHGIPDNRILNEGDLIGIDIGIKYRGYCGDACYTFPVGNVSAKAEKLMTIGKEALKIGIDAAQSGGYLNDIGTAINDFTDAKGVSIVHEWGGHGIGQSLHEVPSVSHIRQSSRGPKLRPGMTFTIEPMINQGTHEWFILNDGWTVVTGDGALSVQYEHSIAITKNGPEILTIL